MKLSRFSACQCREIADFRVVPTTYVWCLGDPPNNYVEDQLLVFLQDDLEAILTKSGLYARWSAELKNLASRIPALHADDSERLRGIIWSMYDVWVWPHDFLDPASEYIHHYRFSELARDFRFVCSCLVYTESHSMSTNAIDRVQGVVERLLATVKANPAISGLAATAVVGTTW